jgi:hypothetical protein
MANKPLQVNAKLTDENGVEALSVATGGAVTLGPTSGTTTTSHTFSSRGSAVQTVATISAPNGNAGLFFTSVAGGNSVIATTNDSGLLFRANSTTTIGSYDNAGAWTLGPSGFTGTHSITGAFSVVHTVSGASSSGYSIIATHNNTATTEVLRLTRIGFNSGPNISWMKFNWYNGVSNGEIGTNGSSQFVLTTPSDSRLKTDIKDATYGLSTILALRPVEFKWALQENSPVVKGFIAQEVKAVLPESVDIKEGSGFEDLHSLETSTMIPVLVKAIQELSAKVDSLQSELNTLKGQ